MSKKRKVFDVPAGGSSLQNDGFCETKTM